MLECSGGRRHRLISEPCVAGGCDLKETGILGKAASTLPASPSRCTSTTLNNTTNTLGLNLNPSNVGQFIFQPQRQATILSIVFVCGLEFRAPFVTSLPGHVATHLSLSAVKMTRRSRSREANTRRRRRRLREEKRHSKSTCSRRESDGRHSSIT